MTHPFRPPVPPPMSTRSTESPMDFVYDQPQSSSNSYNPSDRPRSAIRPLKVIHQDDRPPLSVSKPSSWFNIIPHRPNPPPDRPPPRKRLHSDASESMDWETTQSDPTSSKPNSNHPTQQRVDSTTATHSSQTRSASTFAPQTSDQLPVPPAYIPPSTIPSSTAQPHLSPKKIGPASFGLRAHHRSSIHHDDQEGDSSLDMDQVVLEPNITKPRKYHSKNGTKNETRRRTTRSQNQIRSKLGELSFNSDRDSNDDDDDDDSDVQVISNHRHNTLTKPKKSSQPRSDRQKSNGTTTNNYLTIQGYNKSRQGNIGAEIGSQLSTETPYILLVYLQLIFNSSLVLVGLYLIINLILIIRNDINHKVTLQVTKINQEIEFCTQQYNSNRCFPIHQRTQFIEQHCKEWEVCMSKNPNLISRSKIGAETFAEVINGFVDVISWKTMLFIFLSIGIGIYGMNLAMNNYKSKWGPIYHQHDQFRKEKFSFSSPSPLPSPSSRLSWKKPKLFFLNFQQQEQQDHLQFKPSSK